MLLNLFFHQGIFFSILKNLVQTPHVLWRYKIKNLHFEELPFLYQQNKLRTRKCAKYTQVWLAWIHFYSPKGLQQVKFVLRTNQTNKNIDPPTNIVMFVRKSIHLHGHVGFRHHNVVNRCREQCQDAVTSVVYFVGRVGWSFIQLASTNVILETTAP